MSTETYLTRITIDRALAAGLSDTEFYASIRQALIAQVPVSVASIVDVLWTAYNDPRDGALLAPELRNDQILITGEITYIKAEETRMDYRALLVKYMAEVLECEGVSFVGASGGFAFNDDRYTPTELAMLETIEAEASALNHAPPTPPQDETA